MMDEPLDRCVCNALPGFLFDGHGAKRRVAIGCPHCGTRTEPFPLDQAENAILAWEAGEFTGDAVPLPGLISVPRQGKRPVPPHSLRPAKLRG